MKIIIIIVVVAIIGAIIGALTSKNGRRGESAAEGAIFAGGGCFYAILSLLMWIVPIILGIVFIAWLFD